MKTPLETPEVLDRMTDLVLAYRPKPKSKAAKKRVRQKKLKEKQPKPAE